jgi:hypothetical protein
VFGSMVLLALSGGFGQLGGLGQALAGPPAPSASPAANRLIASTRASLGPLLPVVARAGRPTLVASVNLPRTPARGGGHPATGAPTPGSGIRGGVGPTLPVPTTQPTAPTQPTSPSPGGPPTTQPAPPQTLVDGVVAVGTSVTSKVPGPVGQLATNTLQNVGQAVDKVLPSNARSAASSTTAAVSSSASQVESGAGKLGSGVSGLVSSPSLP